MPIRVNHKSSGGQFSGRTIDGTGFIGQLLVVMLITVLLGTGVIIAQQNSDVDFETRSIQAVNLYRSAMENENSQDRLAAFRQSEIAFRDLIESINNPTAKLMTGWGNASLQSRNNGFAVLAYKRALRLQPDNAQARENLEFLREQLQVWEHDTQKKGMFGTLFFWCRFFGDEEIAAVAGLFFVMGCGLVAVTIRFQIGSLWKYSVIPFLIWGIMLIPCYFSGSEKGGLEVVFVAEETIARNADAMNSPASFETLIPAGVEAVVEEVRDQWLHVKFAGNRRGWVPRSAIEFVNVQSTESD
jgi:hypothetical protein